MNIKSNIESFKALIKAVVIVLSFFLVFEGYGQKISTSPTRLNFKVPPGGSQRGKITVANNSEELQVFQVLFSCVFFLMFRKKQTRYQNYKLSRLPKSKYFW